VTTCDANSTLLPLHFQLQEFPTPPFGNNSPIVMPAEGFTAFQSLQNRRHIFFLDFPLLLQLSLQDILIVMTLFCRYRRYEPRSLGKNILYAHDGFEERTFKVNRSLAMSLRRALNRCYNHASHQDAILLIRTKESQTDVWAGCTFTSSFQASNVNPELSSLS
jgi:hypothetical protein